MTIPIIDCLTHISTGPDDVIGWGPCFLAEDLLAQMNAPRKVLGEPRCVDKAIVFPALGLTVPTSTLTFEEQHAYVAESVARHPDRLAGGIVMQPRLWNDQVAETVRAMVRKQGFRMLYLNPSLHKFWLPIKTPSEGAGARQLLTRFSTPRKSSTYPSSSTRENSPMPCRRQSISWPGPFRTSRSSSRTWGRRVRC